MLYFLSGLPRSGSTLLLNILAQNPKMHVTPTSPLSDQLVRIRNTWERINEYRACPRPENARTAMKGFVQGFYAGLDNYIVFDKHRGWPAHIELIEHVLDRKIKIVATVRAIPEILASFELLYRRDKAVRMPVGEEQAPVRLMRLEDRCLLWASSEGLVGAPYFVLRDALMRGYDDRFHFVDFERLTTAPKQALQELYLFLDQPYFEHDFDNVKQVLFENDMEYGYGDLHTIRPKVESVPFRARTLLPRDIVQKFSAPEVAFWAPPSQRLAPPPTKR